MSWWRCCGRPRSGLTFGLAATAAVTISAQQPVFRTGVDLVTLDVTVVDKDGQPITGLRPQDFVITLNGKPRPVRVLDFIEPGATAPSRQSSNAQASGAGSSAKSDGRVVLLLFDDLSYEPGRGRELIESALRLLPSFADSDYVGVATTSGDGPAVTPTRDHETVAAALRQKSLVGRYDDTAAPFYIGMNEALEIERGIPKQTFEDVVDRECLIVMPIEPRGGGPPRPDKQVCPPLVEAAARRLAQTALTRAEMQLAGYAAAIESVKSAGAPRVIVALTAGLAASAERGELGRQLEPVARAASDAGVEFYALTEAPDGADAADRTGERAQARRSEGRFLTEGVQTVATTAGGDAFLVSGTADRFFRRIQTETSGFYRLGVELPDAHPTIRYLKSNVSVARQGAVVRAHANAIAPGVADVNTAPLAGASIEDRIQGALEQGGARLDVPMSLSSAVRRDPDPAGRVQLAVGVQVPSTVHGPLTAMFALVDEIGAINKEAHARVPQPAAGADYLLTFPIPLDVGTYRLRFAIADADGNIGMIERTIDAHLTRAGAYSMSDLLATWTDRAGRSRFLALDTLPDAAVSVRMALELYVDAGAPAGADPAIRLSLTPAGQTSPLIVRTLTPEKDGSTLRAVADIPAGALGAGTFVVRADLLQDGDVKGTVTTFIHKTTPIRPGAGR